jgi:hypothetical protein
MSDHTADAIQDLPEAELERLWGEYLHEVGVTAEDLATADRVLDALVRP